MSEVHSDGDKHMPTRSQRRVLEEIPQIDGLEFDECIGLGHFSHVFRGKYHGTKDVAIKVIERGSERLITNEVRLLQELQGAPHIIQLYDVIEGEHTLLVFEHVDSVDNDYFFQEITIRAMRNILRSLLEALQAAHSKGIIHRDVKFGNIMIFPDFSDVRLIDWGCGTNVHSNMSSKAGSRSCRSPEMLLGYRDYGTGGDIWAVGMFILYVLADGINPWKAKTSAKAISEMSIYFPPGSFQKLAADLEIEIPSEINDVLDKRPQRKLDSCFSKYLRNLHHPMLIDLMYKLLTFDPRERPTAAEALQHPFFTQ